MSDRTSYPVGVPCWVDLVQPDFEATTAFYGGLFGWTFDVRTPEGAPATYAYALLDGRPVGGLGTPAPGEVVPDGWTQYVHVASADDAAAAVERAGGAVLNPPADVGPSGRVVLCADPEGARFGLWQAGTLAGAVAVNEPGTWSFSELHTADRSRAEEFYGTVLGWEVVPLDLGDDGATIGFWALDGYGAHLAGQDPAAGHDGGDGGLDRYADAVALVQDLGAEGEAAEPRWTVTFGVADADAALARAVELGATPLGPTIDTTYTRMVTVRDPQGATLRLSQYRPPEPA